MATHRYETAVEGDTYCQYPSAESPLEAARASARRSCAKKGALVLAQRLGEGSIPVGPTRRYRVTVSEPYAYDVAPERDVSRATGLTPAGQAAKGCADALATKVRHLTTAEDGAFLAFVNARVVEAREVNDPRLEAYWLGLLSLATTPR